MVTTKYERSELGLIPSNWACLPIENAIIDISMGPFGSNIKVENFKSFGVPVLNGYNVKDYLVNDDVITNYVTPQKACALKKSVASRGDIVITHRGTIGQVAVIPNNSKFQNYVISQSQFRVTLNQKLIDPLFLVYFFHSSKGQSILLEKEGHTGVPALAQPTTNFRKLLVPVPPLLEQRAIVAALSDTDRYIVALKKLIAKKRAIKQGTMQELLTGKRWLPGFEGKWVNFNLSVNSTLKARIGWQGLTTAEYLDEGYAYLITGTDFSNGKIVWSSCHYVDKSRYDQDTNIQVNNGDILITKDGTIGKVAIVTGLTRPATLNSGVFVIRPKDGAYDRTYVYYILLSQIFTDFLAKLTAGSTINHLYQKDFVNFEFETPINITEQAAIATILSDMDAEIDSLTTKLKKARYIKQGMMSELLTGRIRLIQEGTDHG